MTTEPIVVAERVTQTEAALDLKIPVDLAYFGGHFEGAPIVPGVVQIKWAISLARRYLAIGDGFTGMENVKFQHVMTPRSRVTLTLAYAAAARKLRFSFASAEVRYSSGRVVLGTAP